MESAPSELTGIAVAALAAMLCGLVLERLRQPAVVGYIVAGALLGPSAFGLVENRSHVDLLAELGVLLLLFVIGMELSLRSFRRLWKLAALATLGQVCVATATMLALKDLLGWPTGVAVLLGFAVALSSTAVVIKVLADMGELRTRVGRVTVGVLIAQDFAVIPMMLVIEAFAEGGLGWFSVARIGFSLALLGGLVLWLSRGPKVRLPFARMVAGNPDLEPLGGLAFCFAAAAVAGFMGLSAAYGAFLAGLIIGNSHQRHAMLSSIRPIESILLKVFFVSIGLLIDLAYVWRNLGTVFLLLFVVTVFKTAVNVGLLRLLGQSWPHAFLAAVLLAQIGEFSFLLALIGVERGLLGPEQNRLVVAVTALSLALSPLWVVMARRLQALAARGVTSGEELLRRVYGDEVEALADTMVDARTRTLIAARRLAALVRRARRAAIAHRDRSAAAEEALAAPSESPRRPPEAPAQAPAKPPRSRPAQQRRGRRA